MVLNEAKTGNMTKIELNNRNNSNNAILILGLQIPLFYYGFILLHGPVGPEVAAGLFPILNQNIGSYN